MWINKRQVSEISLQGVRAALRALRMAADPAVTFTDAFFSMESDASRLSADLAWADSLPALNELAISEDADRFLEPDDAAKRIRRAAAERPDLVRCVRLGESEEGRPIDGVVLGRGDRHVSLVAGAHADEPVGPDFLRRFATTAPRRLDICGPLLDAFRFFIAPDVNPDGAFRNRAWRKVWNESGGRVEAVAAAYLRHAMREPPGRDVEFGYPDMRPENRAVAAWLREHGPFALHGSLHGMGVSAGALLLIEKHWGYRATRLQERFREAAQAESLPLYDRNRQGEKGFFYLAPGFWTTPEAPAMRAFFDARGDAEIAALFRSSSMEYARSLGGDPLCYVTELPLFVAGDLPPTVGSQQIIAKLRRARSGEASEEAGREMQRLGLRLLPLASALRMHLRTLSAALEQLAVG